MCSTKRLYGWYHKILEIDPLWWFINRGGVTWYKQSFDFASPLPKTVWEICYGLAQREQSAPLKMTLFAEAGFLIFLWRIGVLHCRPILSRLPLTLTPPGPPHGQAPAPQRSPARHPLRGALPHRA